ncbi:MAG: transposase, partial [Lachnospiraceae bacterium]|nr:transposase [Lachnospiraceae bacterium]
MIINQRIGGKYGKKTRTYDMEYKAQAVKLAQEIDGHKAAEELGVPDGTIYCWVKAFKEGRLNAPSAV